MSHWNTLLFHTSFRLHCTFITVRFTIRSKHRTVNSHTDKVTSIYTPNLFSLLQPHIHKQSVVYETPGLARQGWVTTGILGYLGMLQKKTCAGVPKKPIIEFLCLPRNAKSKMRKIALRNVSHLLQFRHLANLIPLDQWSENESKRK